MGASAKQAGGQGCFKCIHHFQGPKFDIALLKLNSTIPINVQLYTERHCHEWSQCMDPPTMSPLPSLLVIHSHHKPWLPNSHPFDRKCSTLVGSLCTLPSRRRIAVTAILSLLPVNLVIPAFFPAPLPLLTHVTASLLSICFLQNP